jgi:hypothetical protein
MDAGEEVSVHAGWWAHLPRPLRKRRPGFFVARESGGEPGMARGADAEFEAPDCTLLNPPSLTRRCQRIRADSRVHAAADMLFRFYVHTPGKPLSVINGKTEVNDAVSRLRSLRSLSATHV